MKSSNPSENFFFSYARADSDFALMLAKDLRQTGVSVWIDQLDIAAGSHWDLEIEKALTASTCVLVVLTPASVASHNVMDEVSYALEGGKRIVPLLLSECTIPFRLKRLQRIDFSKNYAAGLRHLLSSLKLEAKDIDKKEFDAQAQILQETAAIVKNEPKEERGGSEDSNIAVAETRRSYDQEKQPKSVIGRNKRLIIVAALMIAVSFFIWALVKKQDNPGFESSSDPNIDSLSLHQIKRGEYLANYVAVCFDCHSARDNTKWSSPVMAGTEGGGSEFPFGKNEGIPGIIYSPNITPFALNHWTDDEIATAITRGVNKGGDTLFPIMPYHNYSRMAKDDIYSIIAYLRTLKSIDSLKPPRKLDFQISMGRLPQPDLSRNVKPGPSDKEKYGEYLAIFASCGDCHVPIDRKSGFPDFSKPFAGGFVFTTPFFKVAAANITPDSATGIGVLSEDAFVAKFQSNAAEGKVNSNPGRQNTTMPWALYGKMKEEDLRAIYAYLRTVKPINNKVEKWPK